jgi:hypothetical protein
LISIEKFYLLLKENKKISLKKNRGFGNRENMPRTCIGQKVGQINGLNFFKAKNTFIVQTLHTYKVRYLPFTIILLERRIASSKRTGDIIFEIC